MGMHPKQADHRGNDMDVSAFWKIIDDARSNATDDEDFLTRIDSRVRMLEPGELLEFQPLQQDTHGIILMEPVGSSLSHEWRLFR